MPLWWSVGRRAKLVHSARDGKGVRRTDEMRRRRLGQKGERRAATSSSRCSFICWRRTVGVLPSLSHSPCLTQPVSPNLSYPVCLTLSYPVSLTQSYAVCSHIKMQLPPQLRCCTFIRETLIGPNTCVISFWNVFIFTPLFLALRNKMLCVINSIKS